MESLLTEEQFIVDAMKRARVTIVRNLLMLATGRRIPLAKLHHCHLLFGLPDDFRDRVHKYLDYFLVVVDMTDGRHVLELAEWDPALTVSALERDFVPNKDRVQRAFKFLISHGKKLPLEEDDERRLNSLTTLPLVSAYSDGSTLKPWTLAAFSGVAKERRRISGDVEERRREPSAAELLPASTFVFGKGR